MPKMPVNPSPRPLVVSGLSMAVELQKPMVTALVVAQAAQAEVLVAEAEAEAVEAEAAAVEAVAVEAVGLAQVVA